MSDQATGEGRCWTCGEICLYATTSSKPCWGRVIVVEMYRDGSCVHACEGHALVFRDGPYIPKPEGDDKR